MESGAGITNDRFAEVLKHSSCLGQFRNGSNPWMARYVYGLIFLFSNLLAWAARDYGRGASVKMESKIAQCSSYAVTHLLVECLCYFFPSIGRDKTPTSKYFVLVALSLWYMLRSFIWC